MSASAGGIGNRLNSSGWVMWPWTSTIMRDNGPRLVEPERYGDLASTCLAIFSPGPPSSVV